MTQLSPCWPNTHTSTHSFFLTLTHTSSPELGSVPSWLRRSTEESERGREREWGRGREREGERDIGNRKKREDRQRRGRRERDRVTQREKEKRRQGEKREAGRVGELVAHPHTSSPLSWDRHRFDGKRRSCFLLAHPFKFKYFPLFLLRYWFTFCTLFYLTQNFCFEFCRVSSEQKRVYHLHKLLVF